MRRDRRKRTPIINHEERKAALKKLGYGSLCFVVLLGVFAAKEVLIADEPKYTASLPSTTSTAPSYSPSPSSTATTPSYSPTITINQSDLNAARELAKVLSQTPTPIQTSKPQSTEQKRAKYILDGH